jgi:hypothetical protein
VGNPKVPQLLYGNEPVNPVLAAEYVRLRLVLVAAQSSVDAVVAQATTVQNAVLRQSLLKNFQSAMNTLRNQVAAVRQQATSAAPISPALITQLELLLQQIDNLIARINNNIQLIERARSQLQRR